MYITRVLVVFFYLLSLGTPIIASTISEHQCFLEYYDEYKGFEERLIVTCSPKMASINSCILNFVSDRNLILLTAAKLVNSPRSTELNFYTKEEIIRTDSKIQDIRHKVGAPYSQASLNYIESKIMELCINRDFSRDPVIEKHERKLIPYYVSANFSQCGFEIIRSSSYPPLALTSNALFRLACSSPSGLTCEAKSDSIGDMIFFSGTAITKTPLSEAIIDLEKINMSEAEFLTAAVKGVKSFCQ